MNKTGNLRYTCINCGAKVDELYKMYSPSVLKLNTCENCNEISDKYIEYDPVIIMIDLVLLRKEAYRHFLYNTEFRNHWKLAVLVQLMEAYSEWMFNISKNTYFKNMNNAAENNELFFNQYDLQFYILCLKIMFGTCVYNIILYILTFLVEKIVLKTSFINFNMVLKTYTISSFGKFFLLPALIWSDHTGEHLNILFVYIYTTLCQFLVYSFVSRTSMFWTIFIIAVSNSAKILSADMLNTVLLLNQ